MQNFARPREILQLAKEIELKLFKHQNISRVILYAGCGVIAVLAIAALSIRVYVENAVAGNLYDNVETVPDNEYALVLGTSKTLEGKPNEYFTQRIKIAAALYHARKVKYLLVSGARRLHYDYDEPEDMKLALVADGVPESAIVKDNLGFRTLASITRAHQVFKLEKFTIVSQEFHTSRAVYIGRCLNLDVVAVNAPATVPLRYYCWSFIREHLAKVKMFLELHILTIV